MCVCLWVGDWKGCVCVCVSGYGGKYLVLGKRGLVLLRSMFRWNCIANMFRMEDEVEEDKVDYVFC